MRLFAYEVTDRTGNRMQGNIQAASSDAARLALSNAGYTVYSVGDVQERLAPVAATISVPVAVAAKPATAKPVKPTPTATATPTQTRQSPIPPAAPDIVKSRWANEGKTSLMFTQFGSMFRAGINLAKALEEMSLRSRVDIDKQALKEASEAVQAGRSMCDVLERYPYRFSPDVVGTMRAAELAGFMPAACDQIAEQKMYSHKFGNLFKFHTLYGLVLLCLSPFIYGITTGALESMKAQDKAGGNLPIAATLGKYVVHELPNSGLKSLLIIVGLVALYKFWMTMRFRMARHKIAFGIPLFRQRAQAESLTRFAWVLGEVSRVGITPQRALEAAAASIVNLHIREQVMELASNTRENTPLSRVLRGTRLMPREYVDVIENGEMTGELPHALATISAACREDFVRRDAMWRIIAMALGTIIVGIITVVLGFMLYSHLYTGIITTLTED